MRFQSLTGNPKLWKDLIDPSWLAVTITRFHVADNVSVARYRSRFCKSLCWMWSCWWLSVGVDGSGGVKSFSSGHVADPLDTLSAKNQTPREKQSGFLNQVKGSKNFRGVDEASMLLKSKPTLRLMPDQGRATDTPSEEKNSNDLIVLAPFNEVMFGSL